MSSKLTERARLIGERVAAARDEAGLNNSSLAVAAGLPRRTIVRITNGRNEPEAETLEKIARATGKSLDYFRLDLAPASVRVRAAAEDLVMALVEELRAEILASATEQQTEVHG